MATRADTHEMRSESLAAIVDGEIRACEAILAATRAIETALAPLDLDGLESAVAARARQFAHLETLEAQASTLRGPTFAPPATLDGNLATLRDLTEKIREADGRARAATQRAFDDMRSGLRVVAAGQRGLRSYGGRERPAPRFADRRG